jgi:RNA 2',3'-cyclic 3'-phosphodiesterase
VRAFLAIPVTSPALEAGTALLDELRRSVGEVRWVRPEGLHLTLHFWANLHEDNVARVLQAAAAALDGTAPYPAELAGLGAFPRDGDERVLWLGMREGQQRTVALQGAVERALESAGFPMEQRAFHAHVTLGRPRQRLDADARRRWRGFAGTVLPPCAVREVLLYRSQPGPGGSRYEVLARLPLSASR